MLTLAEGLDLIEAFRSGWAGPVWPDDRPLIVVDVDGGDADRLSVPPAFPAVVVAVSRDSPDLAPDGPDVAITGAPDPPPPWVAAAMSVDDLDRAVTGAPGAAVTLVHLLRAGAGVDGIGGGLIHESLAYSVLQAGPEFGRWRDRRPAPRIRPADGGTLLVDRDGPIMTVTLNRPDVHNAYNRQMRDDLCDVLAAAMADPAVTVVVAGRGRSFCSGGDLSEFGTAPDPVTSHIVRVARSPGRLISLMADRVEARIHGVCAGSGIEIPAFAGSVVAHPDTRIWLPELAMGLIPGAGGTVSLPRRIGRQRTAWMALTGHPVDAGTAARWGLVDAVG
ncbi:MAG TPA: enoyl-CoA hydratase/isomerase family protein [Acidimicrobiales bacterium]|nr:enoyl-CoA hydratase/isomerase family protein [Acidimicrobiales bacterium]